MRKSRPIAFESMYFPSLVGGYIQRSARKEEKMERRKKMEKRICSAY
jgi:hypothetical protein